MDDWFPGWSGFVWWQKIGCVLIFIALIGAWAWLVRWFFNDALPHDLSMLASVALLGLLGGVYLGRFLTRRGYI